MTFVTRVQVLTNMVEVKQKVEEIASLVEQLQTRIDELTAMGVQITLGDIIKDDKSADQK